MTTTPAPQHPDPGPPDPGRPDPERVAPNEPDRHREPVEAASTPDAVRAIRATRSDKQNGIVPGRGVEWVRPTDLIARQSAHVAGRGLDFQTKLARRTRAPIDAGVRRLGDRARRLPPLSAFGRSASRSQLSRSGLSMS